MSLSVHNFKYFTKYILKIATSIRLSKKSFSNIDIAMPLADGIN